MHIFFDDLELPHLVKSYIGDTRLLRPRRAGYTRHGTPSSLAVLRTMTTALARRIALFAAIEHERQQLEEALAAARAAGYGVEIERLRGELEGLEKRRQSIHFLEHLDLRFRARVMVPDPSVKAVMFCLMDVSASMNEEKKDLAKRFFTLLYLFLTRKYDSVDVVFLRHTDDAEEVDEETFFHDPKSGGTVVLSALKLMWDIIESRYADGSWNIYGAQASDGDAFGQDPQESTAFLSQLLLPKTRYFAYVETPDSQGSGTSSLWAGYSAIGSEHFAMRRVHNRGDIYPVFAGLFKKQSA